VLYNLLVPTSNSLSSGVVHLFADNFVIDSLQGYQFLVSRPPLPEEGPIQADPASAASEAPEADEGQDGDDAEVSREDRGSTSSPPLLTLKSKVWGRKGSVLTNCFPRVPPFQRMRQGSPLLPSPLILRCLMLWTHEFTTYYYSTFSDPRFFSFLLMSK
jgi:hypothetical protein